MFDVINRRELHAGKRTVYLDSFVRYVSWEFLLPRLRRVMKVTCEIVSSLRALGLKRVPARDVTKSPLR